MKRTMTAVSLLLGFCLSARSQLLLDAGDTYTLNFSSLDLVQANVPGQGAIFNYAALGIGDFSQLDIVRIRAWENNTGETPICDYQHGLGGSCSAPLAWADRQGIVRVDVTQGSITLNSIRVHVEETFGPVANHNVYETTFVPVPEPSISLLIGAAVCLAPLWRARMKRTNLRIRRVS